MIPNFKLSSKKGINLTILGFHILQWEKIPRLYDPPLAKAISMILYNDLKM